MTLSVKDCPQRAGNTTCPVCGRTAPDVCGAATLAPVAPAEGLTGSDLPESIKEVQEANVEQTRIATEEAVAEEKILQGRRGRKAL